MFINFCKQSWGGKENGLDLVKCCCYTDLSNFPASATAVNFEYTIDTSVIPTTPNTTPSSSAIIPPASATTPTSGAAAGASVSTVVTSSPATANAPLAITDTQQQQQSHSTGASSSSSGSKTLITKHVRLDKVHLIHENPAVIMEHVLKEHPDIPDDKRILLYTYIRLAHSFPNYEKRKLFVQTRLQSLSILVYSGAIQEHANNLLYDGLIEELVDVLTVKDSHASAGSASTSGASGSTPAQTPVNHPIPPFPEIKAASLKTLTAIIHLEKTNKLTEIIETTQAASYHGLLPTLVRKCVDHLIDSSKEPFPHQFATSLFSFLYHLATYDTGGDALVKCGIMETLLKVVNHNHNSQEFIMFVTRAVRVIDLITNLDMSSFEAHNGLNAFINRLAYEVNECRKEQPFEIKVKSSAAGNLNRSTSAVADSIDEHNEPSSGMEQTPSGVESQQTDTGAPQQQPQSSNLINIDTYLDTIDDQTTNMSPGSNVPTASKTGLTCYHQRSALLKSILNFFKKVLQLFSFLSTWISNFQSILTHYIIFKIVT